MKIGRHLQQDFKSVPICFLKWYAAEGCRAVPRCRPPNFPEKFGDNQRHILRCGHQVLKLRDVKVDVACMKRAAEPFLEQACRASRAVKITAGTWVQIDQTRRDLKNIVVPVAERVVALAIKSRVFGVAQMVECKRWEAEKRYSRVMLSSCGAASRTCPHRDRPFQRGGPLQAWRRIRKPTFHTTPDLMPRHFRSSGRCVSKGCTSWFRNRWSMAATISSSRIA